MAKTRNIELLSKSVSDYLKALYAIGKDGGVVTTGALAVKLEIAPASVTNMLQKLAALDPPLVDGLRPERTIPRRDDLLVLHREGEEDDDG